MLEPTRSNPASKHIRSREVALSVGFLLIVSVVVAGLVVNPNQGHSNKIAQSVRKVNTQTRASPNTAISLTPSADEVSHEMAQTVLRYVPSIHFIPRGRRVITSDGLGGLITAQIGSTYPTANKGFQLVFFWHGSHFLSWNEGAVSHIQGISAGNPGQFAVTFQHYLSGDPLCCPSGAPVQLLYTWNGSRIESSGTSPSIGGASRQVKLLP